MFKNKKDKTNTKELSFKEALLTNRLKELDDKHKELIEQCDNIKKQDHDIETEMAVLKSEIQKMREKASRRFRAEIGGIYFYVSSTGLIKSETESNSSVDTWRYGTGNYFETSTEASQYRGNILVKQKLKDVASRLNKGLEIDWNDDTQSRWGIGYDFKREMFTFCSRKNQQDLGQVYCLDENFLEVAKIEIGVNPLIRLIKSGV